MFSIIFCVFLCFFSFVPYNHYVILSILKTCVLKFSLSDSLDKQQHSQFFNDILCKIETPSCPNEDYI